MGCQRPGPIRVYSGTWARRVDPPSILFGGVQPARLCVLAGAAPRDKASNDALGGNWITAGTLEMRVPLGLPEEFGLAARCSRIGAWAVGRMTCLPAAWTMMSVFAGPPAWVCCGLRRWGPVSLELAKALVKESYDEEELFRVNFGSRF